MTKSKVFKTWIYHKTEEPKVINSDEFEGYKAEGWADTPAGFIHIVNDFGIDKDDALAVQQLGETIQGVVDSNNGALNLETMTKKELEAYGRKHLDIELDCRKSKGFLVKQIKSLLEA